MVIWEGTIKGVTAHLKLKKNAVPKFFKLRPVPFALKEKIVGEPWRLEKIGVLEKWSFLDWATPIVPLLKPDGSVRVCGDYKVTTDPVLEVSEHYTYCRFIPCMATLAHTLNHFFSREHSIGMD